MSEEVTSLCPCVVSSERGRPREKQRARRGGVEERLASLFKVSCFYLKKSWKDIRKQAHYSETEIEEEGTSSGDRL